MTTPTPEPTLGEVAAKLDALTAKLEALPAALLLTQVAGLSDGTKTARPLRGLLAVLNNRSAEVRDAQRMLSLQAAALTAQVAELQRVVDGGTPKDNL